MAERGVIETRRSLDGLRGYVLRQRWNQPDIDDIPEAVVQALNMGFALQRIHAGDRIAITAGSRGIASMPQVLRAVVDAVRHRGGRPFIFPAMGSHGGGTAEGQREMLAGMGISEETMGVPIYSSMEVVQLGRTSRGMPVYLDAHAAQADGIIVVNRVKKHTNFDAPIESGLAKMSVIGMGKHTQAELVHKYGNYGLREYIPQVAKVVFEQAPVLVGLAILENAWGGVAEILGLAPDTILDREPALLTRAKTLSAKIPFHDIHIALVEQMGKDISGTGMDCYVIGRRRIVGEPEWPECPEISTLVVADLTDVSHGNAVGVGLADMTTRRLADRIDWAVTQKNVMTSGNLERGRLPLVFESVRQALEAAAFRERTTPIEELRCVAIRDTLHLRELFCSEALIPEAEKRNDLQIVSGPLPLPLGSEGQWTSPMTQP